MSPLFRFAPDTPALLVVHSATTELLRFLLYLRAAAPWAGPWSAACALRLLPIYIHGFRNTRKEHTMAKGNPNWPSTTGKPSGGGRGNGGKGK